MLSGENVNGYNLAKSQYFHRYSIGNSINKMEQNMREEIIKYDIKVINAFKKYGQNNVFNGLNMSVKSGSM